MNFGARMMILTDGTVSSLLALIELGLILSLIKTSPSMMYIITIPANSITTSLQQWSSMPFNSKL
jgi:hypothetical protein